MRRAIRHAFTVLAALSLFVSLAVCVLWVRGGSVRDSAATSRIRREPDRSATAVWVELSNSDRLWLRTSFARVSPERPGPNRPTPKAWGGNWDSYYQRADATGGRWRWWFNSQPIAQPDGWGGLVLFNLRAWGPIWWMQGTQNTPPFVQHNLIAGIPHWLLALLLLILPASVAARRLVRSRRARRAAQRGLCPACGYDLRATPDQCPECGAVAPLVGAKP